MDDIEFLNRKLESMDYIEFLNRKLETLNNEMLRFYPSLVEELAILLKQDQNYIEDIIQNIVNNTPYQNYEIVDIMLDYQRCLNNGFQPDSTIDYLVRHRSYRKRMIEDIIQQFQNHLNT